MPDIGAGWIEGVGVGGDTPYVTLGPGGLATFDVSNPASPVWLGTITLDGTWGKDVMVETRRQLRRTPAERRHHTAGAVCSPDGNQLVVVQQGMFSVYDVADPRNPKLVAFFEGHGQPFTTSHPLPNHP